MKLSRLWLLGVVGSSVGAVACFDLFHSTAGILTACELDAMADGCGTSEVTTDFCAWSPSEALEHAQHACAWLGACGAPTGGNALGACVFQALLALDCSANPDHRVVGPPSALWDCLQRATSCGDVERCVLPGQNIQCKNAGSFCVPGTTAVRVDCGDAGGGHPGTEPCALWGQSCAGGSGVAQCAGSEGPAGLMCTEEACSGTKIHWCDPKTGLDIGLDCADNGAGRCGGFPTRTAAQWLACVPEGDGGCEPDASVSCVGGIAHSCPAGVPEQIDCAGLLGSAGACSPGPLSPPFDWTSSCVLSPPACNADSCSEDAGTAVGCTRGTAMAVNCAQEGLGPCRMIAAGTDLRAACTPPLQDK
jgi:hypothetical protein